MRSDVPYDQDLEDDYFAAYPAEGEWVEPGQWWVDAAMFVAVFTFVAVGLWVWAW